MHVPPDTAMGPTPSAGVGEAPGVPRPTTSVRLGRNVSPRRGLSSDARVRTSAGPSERTPDRYPLPARSKPDSIPMTQVA